MFSPLQEKRNPLLVEKEYTIFVQIRKKYLKKQFRFINIDYTAQSQQRQYIPPPIFSQMARKILPRDGS
jgi:hypothetical protein